MAVVTITVNGRLYEIACDDSQTARVQELGGEVDSRAQTLLKQLGNVPDARLLVMVGLMFADELSEMREQLKRAGDDVAAAAEGDQRLAEGVENLAGRIEAIAERLERS
ncbi:cell division protein ZapA [Magnetospirillum sp. UT-4]|uniref:cell division protein ZapA n=1 Tax=Magnetospirillum sp. UT-4 TaxID=2681467 RepID=UPI001381291B|nr:cell division protein ZapA [Magnetospirillum sp. UT-4]CAA7615142.1 conserved hypothetical protein [Magnetospirillum sp. UT-4]